MAGGQKVSFVVKGRKIKAVAVWAVDGLVFSLGLRSAAHITEGLSQTSSEDSFTFIILTLRGEQDGEKKMERSRMGTVTDEKERQGEKKKRVNKSN